MKKRNTILVLTALTLFLIASCAGSRSSSLRQSEEPSGSNESLAKKHFITAKALEKAGRHLEASIYFEAALDSGGDELDVLPSLVVSQVRAGRLEAAKQAVERLNQIAPDRTCVDELSTLLGQLTPSDGADLEGGIR